MSPEVLTYYMESAAKIHLLSDHIARTHVDMPELVQFFEIPRKQYNTEDDARRLVEVFHSTVVGHISKCSECQRKASDGFYHRMILPIID